MLAFYVRKDIYLFPTLVNDWHRCINSLYKLEYTVDESANSFTNISLFFIHVLLVYIFQVTQDITNSLYMDIFNKISLNKTTKEAPLQAQCSFCCEKYKRKRSLVTYGGELFRGHFFNREIKHPAHAATVKKSYIHITETKDITCRSLPLNLRSGTYKVEDLRECKHDKTILLP